jgi:hypothetical protein
MATQEVLQVYGTQLLFADHATDFGAAPATAANSLIIGSPTDVQMNMSVIADAAAWQSAKTASLAKTGSAWPIEWVLGACVEHTATPAAGTTMEWYWNPSPSATAGTGNSGGASGADASYAVAGKDQLIFIGTQVLRNNVLNIDGAIGTLWMPYLYGSLIVINKAGVAMVADGDADEIHAVLTPIIPDVQAAA